MLKRHLHTGVFMWILWNFLKQFFYRTPHVLLPSISHLSGINLSSVAFFIMLISDVTKLKKSVELWTKEHMHINKFSECPFWKFWNQPSEERENFKFHKMNEVKWSNFHLTKPATPRWPRLKNLKKHREIEISRSHKKLAK